VSERLLAAKRFNVLALRIVQPAILGAPHNVLAPVLGHPQGFVSGLPFMRLLGPNVERLHVLMVVAKQAGHTRYADDSLPGRADGPALEYVESVQRELRQVLPRTARLEGAVVRAPDPPAEIVLAAKQQRSQLIYLGASERSLARRLFRGAPYETVLEHASCDVAIYRGVP
jgi:nucleotide-binding universal stress UspA family protein